MCCVKRGRQRVYSHASESKLKLSNTMYAAVCTFIACNKRSVLRRQCWDTNRNIKSWCSANTENVLSVGQRHFAFYIAAVHQLFIFRFLSCKFTIYSTYSAWSQAKHERIVLTFLTLPNTACFLPAFCFPADSDIGPMSNMRHLWQLCHHCWGMVL